MQFFTGVLNRITQEDGSLPGEPLGTFLGIVYFLVIPTALFVVISALGPNSFKHPWLAL